MWDQSLLESSRFSVRSWYGLRAEIAVGNHYWHLVKVEGIPLPHPALVNLLLRRGLPEKIRLQLSSLHEFGHLQTFPLAMLQAVLLMRSSRQRKKGLLGLVKVTARQFLAHELVWELLSEGYVVIKIGKTYLESYRQYPKPVGQTLFWIGVIGLAFYCLSS